MPITFVPNPNGVVLGPGVPIGWSSDFVGPLPTGTQWEIDLRGDGGETAIWIAAILGTQSPFAGRYTPWVQSQNPGWGATINVQNTIRDGSQAHADVRLRTPTGVVDSGTLSGTWDSRSGIALDLESTAAAQGGFTASDRTLLQATETRSQVLGSPLDLFIDAASGPIPITLAQLFSRPSLDQLLFEEITNGPTGDPVRIVLAIALQYGITIRLTTVPDDIQFKTPDGEWSFPDLAVLRIFQGTDLVYRRGIHTVTWSQDIPWAWGNLFRLPQVLGVPPYQTQILVDWRAGCEGQVFIRHMP